MQETVKDIMSKDVVAVMLKSPQNSCLSTISALFR